MNELLISLERASVQGAIALAVVWILCRLLSRLPASFRCWLWRLAFLKCLVGLFLAFTVAVPILPATPPVTPLPAVVTDSAIAPEVLPVTPERKPDTEYPAFPVEETPVVAESPWNSPSSWLLLCYALGVAAGVVRLMVGGVRTWQLVRRAETVTHPALTELAARFGRRTVPRLARSAEVTSPLLAFSTILLPRIPSDDEPLILGHELAHLQRRDLAWEWLGTVTQIVFWFHPLVWLARREERMTREQAADTLAIAVTAVPPADYARALVAASLRRNGRIPTLSVGAVERGSRLRQRLDALTQPGFPRRWAIALTGIAVAFALVAFVPWKAVARQQPTPPANEPTAPLVSDAALSPGNGNNEPKRDLAVARQNDAPRQTSNDFLTVYLPDGKPASDTRVYFDSHLNSERQLCIRVTDSQGRCLVSPLEPGRYEVRVIRSADGLVAPDGTILEIAKNGSRVLKSVTLVPAGRVSGRITDQRGKPLRQQVDVDSGWSRTRTGENGTYSFLIPVGRAAITAGGSAPRTVIIRSDKPTTLDFSLAPEALGIPIRVLNSQGKPVRARLDIRWDSGSGSYATNDAGKLHWKPHFKPQADAKVYAFSGTEGAVATIPPGPYKPLDLELSEQKVGQVTFRVTDTAQKPIPNLMIEIVEGSSSYGDVFRPLDGEGRYRLPVRPDATIQLRAYSDGYQPWGLFAQPGEKTIVVRAGESKDLGHFILPPAKDAVFADSDQRTPRNMALPTGVSSINGTVHDSKGRPIAPALRMLHPRMEFQFSCQEPGQFSFRPPVSVPGAVTIFAYQNNEGAFVTVPPGQTKPLGLQLSPKNVGHINVRITDAANRPIPNLSVRVTADRNYPYGNAPSNKQGNYHIPVQPNTPYRLEVLASNFQRQKLFARPGVEEIKVRSGETKDLGHVVLTATPPVNMLKMEVTSSRHNGISTPTANQEAASKTRRAFREELTGAVTSSLGQPVPNAKVSWVAGGPSNPKIIAETTSNERGEFSFTDASFINPTAAKMPLRLYWHLSARTWLMVRADGFALGVRQLRYGTVHVKVELMPPTTYTAAFRDTQGRPIVGLPVWADGLENDFSYFRLRWLGYESKTDARGEFQATGLPPNYSVCFEFDRTRWTVVNKDLDVDQVPIPKDGKIVYILDTGYTVEGTVRHPDGQPAKGVGVRANPFPATPGRAGASDQTDSQGRYRLVGLGVGEHQLRVNLVHKIPNIVAPNAIPLSIPKQQTRLCKDLVLQPAAKVVGWVTDKKGKPLSGLTVTNGTTFGVSAGNGYYEVNVPAGEASLGIPGKYKQTIHTRADRPIRLDFAIERDRVTEVEGEVVDEYNRPIPGANVHIFGERTSGRTVTNSEGKFSWGNVYGKQASLSVYAECGTAGASAKVTPQDTGPLRLTLSEKAVGHLTGKVTDAEGRAISGLKILVMANGSGTGNNPPTDDQGRFQIAVRPDAVYSLQFNAPGYGERGVPDYFQGFRSTSLKEQKWLGKLYGVQPGERKDLGHIVMVKGPDNATGQIRDPENRPVSYLQLQLVTPSGQWFGKTNFDGEFTIPGMVQGERAVLLIYNVKGDYRRNWIRRDLTVGAMGVIRLTNADIIQAPQ